MAISGTFDKDNVQKFNDIELEVSLDGGSSWEGAIESWATQLVVERGEVETASTKTLDGSNHVTPGASIGPGTGTVTCIYDETATAPFKNINDFYTATPGGAADLRWAPGGGVSADYQYTTSGGYMTACSLPMGDANDNEAGKFSFTIVFDDAAQTAVV